ncbi:beta 1-4 rhamnosyltransferase Cps2T, partial [Liquorilactobacillus hordei]|uniref:beta 1-4 rhamnosyltransferase Cps2T n=1 Tax=Liquorilactobacillus hordei TaxID=468911 RepID=UPI0039EA3191
MKDVFIIGSKGIPANYGGFETFVDNLVSRKKDKEIKYHVACMTLKKQTKEYEYHGASCQQITVPNIGGAKAVVYDLKALNWALKTIKEKNIRNGIIYILACRVGPFLHYYVEKFHNYGFKIWVNPDGHEWKRAKWAFMIRKYWKASEKLMIKNSDFIICDSKTIEKYIHQEYQKYNPKTKFIAYGADVTQSSLTETDKTVKKWFEKNKVILNTYFLIVGRFVPENNFEVMIREFMSSDIRNDLIIVTNVEKNKFYERLKQRTHFERDSRIKFVGTVYDQQLLKFIREHALAYIHGHSVGGTNPSLLEALASTKLNLLYNVGFNKEVGGDGALYWSKENGSLVKLLNLTVSLHREKIEDKHVLSKKIILNSYSWEKIIDRYEKCMR